MEHKIGYGSSGEVLMSLKTAVSELALQISTEILLPNFARVKASQKCDGSLLTEADIKAHEAFLTELPKLADYPVLSEEMSESEQQFIVDNSAANFWCIDPLDGTSNFTVGIPYWCMSIALIEDGALVMGVIYDPNRDECFAATNHSTTTLNDNPLTKRNNQISEIDQCMGLVDFKRLDGDITTYISANPPYRSQRSFGASALDFCWLADNRCQLYLHGRQKLWDYSAGLLILQQAGGVAETFDGEDIFQNDLQPKSILAASDADLLTKWRDYFQTIPIK